jgi:hypothetical protein
MTAVGYPLYLIVELEEPLNERVVRDGFGDVRERP